MNNMGRQITKSTIVSLIALGLVACADGNHGSTGSGGDPTEIRRINNWEDLKAAKIRINSYLENRLEVDAVNFFKLIPSVALESTSSQIIYQRLLDNDVIERIKQVKIVEPKEGCKGDKVKGKQKSEPFSSQYNLDEICADREALAHLEKGPATNAEILGEYVHELAQIILGLNQEGEQNSQDEKELEQLAHDVEQIQKRLGYQVFAPISSPAGTKGFYVRVDAPPSMMTVNNTEAEDIARADITSLITSPNSLGVSRDRRATARHRAEYINNLQFKLESDDIYCSNIAPGVSTVIHTQKESFSKNEIYTEAEVNDSFRMVELSKLQSFRTYVLDEIQESLDVSFNEYSSETQLYIYVDTDKIDKACSYELVMYDRGVYKTAPGFEERAGGNLPYRPQVLNSEAVTITPGQGIKPLFYGVIQILAQ